MWLLRLLAVILVVGIGLSFLLYLLSGQSRYLTLAGRALRYGIVFALLVFALMIIERVAGMV